MGHKRKGQLTTDIEWHKHLRKIGKRFFWKGERKAEKKMVNENLSELNTIIEFPSLTFDKLFDLIEENRFENETDKKIAEKILEAERDWRISFETVNEFINVLEKAVGGIVTKSSLNKLSTKYKRNISQNAWEMESISYLLDVFELTKETELKKIIFNLTEKIEIE